MRTARDRHSARHLLAESASWAAGSLLLAVMIWAVQNGPRLHAVQEEQVAVEEETEDHEVCGRFSMPLGSASYPVCAFGLGEVRRAQKARMEQRAAGLL